MEKTHDVENSSLDHNENCLCYTLPFDSDKLNEVKNLCIVNATMQQLNTSYQKGRFNNIPLSSLNIRNP